MTAQPFKRISPAEVTRDEYGYWLHPDFPHFEEVIITSEWQDYLDQNKLQSKFVDMDGDAPEYVTDGYFATGNPEYCSAWEPTPPDGEGYFLFGIWDTDDGPTSCWVRHNEDAGALGGAA